MYPQIYLNYKLQSVEGFKLDYPYLNLSGFIMLGISSSVGFFFELPFKNYGLGNLRIQDLLYSYNGTFVQILLMLQAIFYKRGKNTINLFSFYFTIIAWASSLALYCLSEVYFVVEPSQNFNIVIYLGHLKVLINMIKYIPLIYYNFLRKDTGGISIVAFVLNLIGASFALVQMALDVISGTTDTINPVKTALAAATIFYDILLIAQYYAYKNNKVKKELTESVAVTPNLYDLNRNLIKDGL